MPTFQYTPVAGGGSTADVIDAPDRASAVRLLRARGITPLRLEPMHDARSAAGASSGPIRVPVLGRSVSRSDFASLIREIATAAQAGLTVMQALKTVGRQGRSPAQRDMINHLVSELEQGRSLAEAAKTWGRPFDDLTVGLIRAGEASGRLEEVLDQTALLLDRDVEMRRSLMAATLYPAILLGLISLAVGVVVTVIVPKILEPLEGQMSASDLPMPTRVVQGVADFAGAYWWAVIAAIVLIVLGVRKVYATPGPRLAVDSFALKIPVFGRLIRDVAVARFTRTLATLVSAGLPVLSSLSITRATLGNRALESAIDEVCAEVAGGATIAEPMERVGFFPPLLVQIIGVGERSGKLDSMLRQAAGAFERRTESTIKLFTNVLPPLLVLLLAGVVGFVIAAVLLPLLEFQEAIG